jgi:hypothetical protein
MERWNYFNYFTEIEEYFWKKRGAHLLVSPLDWAIMETWQKAGVPLEAVLKGIDLAFESYARSRRGAGKPLKSLAYCTDAVLEAAEEAQEAAAGSHHPAPSSASAEHFSREEVKTYIEKNSAAFLRSAANLQPEQSELIASLRKTAAALEDCKTILDAPGVPDLEDLERRLTVLEDKVFAALMSHASNDLMLLIRQELDRQLLPYRRKMRAEQLSVIERQYLHKRLLEEYRLPRLSLFYFS